MEKSKINEISTHNATLMRGPRSLDLLCTHFVFDAFLCNFFTIFCFQRLVLGLLSDVVQVGTQHLNALNVVALVKLLVDRVSTVC